MFFRKVTGRNDLVSDVWQQPIPININGSKVECFDQESVLFIFKTISAIQQGASFLVAATETRSSLHFPCCSVTSCQYKKI